MIKIKYTLILFFLISLFKLNAQTTTGLIPIQTFGTEDYKTQPKNRAFAEDKWGAIYVGNKEALLVYTGSWKKYVIDNHNDVYSIDVSEDGKIFVGGDGEFGFFHLDSNRKGSLIYHPLYKLLDSNDRSNIGKIWHTHSISKTSYFSSNSLIYIYNEGNISIVKPPGSIVIFEKIHNRLFVGIKGYGLFELRNGKLQAFGKHHEFSIKDGDNYELDIKSVSAFGDSKVVYITKGNQLRTYDLSDKKGKSKVFHTQLDSIFKKEQIVKVFNLNNQLFAVYSSGNGIYIIDHNGRFIRMLDAESGLKEETVEEMFLDSQNNLWVSHDNGLSRVAIYSNYEYFPSEKTGIKRRVQGITRFNGKLYIGTELQLYYLDENNLQNKKILTKEDVSRKNFTKGIVLDLDESKGKGNYGILDFYVDGKKSLLFITNEYVFHLKEDGNVDTALYKSGSVIINDPMNPNRIWIGLYPKGLGSFYYDNGKWIDEGAVPNTEFDIRVLSFDENFNLWMGRTDGLSMLNKPVFTNHKVVKPQVNNYNLEHGLPSNDAICPFFNGEEMMFGSSEGLFIYNNKDEKFIHSNSFTSWFLNRHVHRMIMDKQNNIWTVTYPLDHNKILLKKLIRNSEGGYFVNSPYAKEVTAQQFDVMYQDGQSLWTGGTFDLVKINNISSSDTNVQIQSYINSVLIKNDSVLFDGFHFDANQNIVKQQDINLKPIVLYKYNEFTFHYSAIAQKLESEPSYRIFLEGYDEDWGAWSSKIEVRYTNLHEGDYIFRMQAKDIYGNISEEANYSFTIRPPWHRTVWAYIGFFLSFVIFVWGAIRISTRSLKKIIREATAEIRAQKDDIEEKSQSIMSSIRYAQRIQEAVSPQKKLMDKVFPEHFVLWKPRDIVSGDFYWMMQKDNKSIIAAADCTGHGVPGAFMSIMGISFLNEIANSKEVQTAAEALNQLRNNVITSLNQEGAETDTKDGMDMSICVYDFDNMMMQFAGAYNPLYMIRDGELSVIKADRMPIGVHERDQNPFTNMEFSMHKGDIYYILSDGYIDQFGGPKGKKFMTKRFKQLILDIHTEPMEKQNEILWETFTEWRGDIEQIDDIIIIGIKVV